ncbi:hypothetical protein CC85DRAFT_191071 [Cutaneotrichosporon oleaginosum]|uniref:Uncharacterized protein n=1 Tax=Cutaneotrichosporon oleaginosum TaxID=879819 RepID=A0A0J0XV25_9TREE|nr:uncharacterized protein CC85DRAFT_191071 [Cutaneotrichosporon oleaginosum]KLT44918.1 hypothetical protein CC85DRAFT_191071 [Cutaneotrichosporon oleaginosum]TXT12046.1 hypothetical protein COLE_02456 [Cutaneotrichosporon oleaginosum]
MEVRGRGERLGRKASWAHGLRSEQQRGNTGGTGAKAPATCCDDHSRFCRHTAWQPDGLAAWCATLTCAFTPGAGQGKHRLVRLVSHPCLRLFQLR